MVENLSSAFNCSSFSKRFPFFSLVLQGDYDAAETTFEKCQEISENAIGPEHPRFAIVLNNRAKLLESQVRVDLFLEYSEGRCFPWKFFVICSSASFS